jgi:hypothetical protein
MLVMADGSNCSDLFADHASMQLVLAVNLFFLLVELCLTSMHTQSSRTCEHVRSIIETSTYSKRGRSMAEYPG